MQHQQWFHCSSLQSQSEKFQDRTETHQCWFLMFWVCLQLFDSRAWTFCASLCPQPPIVPKVSHEGDTSNFDVYPEDDWKKDPPVPQKDLEIFKNFWPLCLTYLLDCLGNWHNILSSYCHRYYCIMEKAEESDLICNDSLPGKNSNWHVRIIPQRELAFCSFYLSDWSQFFCCYTFLKVFFFSEPAHMQKVM